MQREHDALLNHSELTVFIQNHADLYNTMKKANAIIWDMMDVLRTNISTEEYLKTCKDCIEFNDIRFPVHVADTLYKASTLTWPDKKDFEHPFHWAAFTYTGV